MRYKLVRALLAVTAAFCFSGAADAAIVVSGNLQASYPTWNRISDNPDGAGSYLDSLNDGLPYEVLEIRTPAIGDTLTVSVNGTTQFDSFLALYSSFNPAAPLTNILAADDDSAGYPHARIIKTGLAANTSYFLVVTSYSGTGGSVFPRYGNYALTLGGSFSVVPQGTSTGIGVSLNPSTFGQAITLSATVTQASGIATPTGTVTFMDGLVTLGSGTLDASAQALLTTTSLSVGTHSISAIYGGEARYSTSTSTPLSLTVLGPPGAVTAAASGISATGATLNGSVNDNGSMTSASFDFGTTAAYGTNIAATTGGTVGAGSGATPVAVNIGGLSCNILYHFRVKAVNVGGIATGNDATFRSGPCVPDAPTAPSAIAGNAQASVTFTAPASDGGAPISTYTATANPGGASGTCAGPAACTITVSSLTNGASYTFTVTATNAASLTSAASVASNSVTPKGTQTIGTISFTPPTVTVGTVTTASATATSLLAVAFTSSTPLICTATGSNGSTITGVGVGTCSITADQAGNASYLAAPPATQTIAVGQATQTIGTISFLPATLVVGGTTTASATATSLLSVAFTSSTPLICTATGSNGSTLTGVAAGTCSITANQVGNANYLAAAPATQTIAVGQATQTIGMISFLPATLVVGGTTTASATATSLLAVAFTSSTPLICTATGSNGSTLTGVGVGTCNITANQVGNANYLAAAPVTQTIAVGQATQTIGTISFTPATVAVGSTTTASATATSLLAVTFTSSTPLICTATGSNGSTLTGVGVGTCSITANQVGNANYLAAAPVTQTIAVGQGTQTIGTISLLPTTLVVGGTTTASATATSGLAVSFTSSTPLICTATGSNGSTLTGVGVGACSITADQAGNASYLAAPPITQTITVDPARSTLSNISARGQVRTGANVMIGGFIVSGATPKTVLIRARGPSLAAFGVPGVLANPTVALYSGSTNIASNDNWGSAANAAAISATGFAPTDSLESAILTTLSPGPYTAIVTGVGGTSGVGIVEVLEIDNPASPLSNISTRGWVQTGANVMIGGFIISGTIPKSVLIRARGPSLAAFGVPGVLANPSIGLYSGSTVIASNDNWGSAANAAAISATGQAPTDSMESAILMTLSPGPYTVIVQGVGGTSGVAILEVLAQ